jgi:hypothetical protein
MLSRQIRENKCFKTDIVEDEAFSLNKELFKEKFVTKLTFNSSTAMENMSNAQFAANLYSLGMFSKEYLLKNIMHDSDPAGTLRQAKLDRLYAIQPMCELADITVELTDDKAEQADINRMKFKLARQALVKQLKEGQAPAQPGAPAPAGSAAKPVVNEQSSIEAQVKQKEAQSGQTAVTTSTRPGGV